MGRILAVDPGARRVGLAVTDPLQLIASPWLSIEFTDRRKLVERLLELIRQQEAELVVVGLPIREDGSEGKGCRWARRLARLLARSGVRVELWDERYSSREAEEALRRMGLNRKKALARIDPVAAAVILQDYLSSRR